MADALNLSDQRSLQGDRRSPLMPFGNGKKRVLIVVISGAFALTGTIGAAYLTAEGVATQEARKSQAALDKAVAVLEAKESAHFDEVMRAIRELREDIREQQRGRR